MDTSGSDQAKNSMAEKRHTKKKQIFHITEAEPLPLGAEIEDGGVRFAFLMTKEANYYLNLYQAGAKKPKIKIPLEEHLRRGNVIAFKIWDLDYNNYEYMYEADGIEFPDPYCRVLRGREEWGKKLKKGKRQIQETIPVFSDERQADNAEKIRCGFMDSRFDWKGDKPSRIPYERMILYKLHVRGFTKHSSSKVKARGTFAGIIEKLPYLEELGINAIELMPIVEFDECEKGRMNYWGYNSKDVCYFAPKSSYAWNRKNPGRELKELIREAHRRGIEIVPEFYFNPGMNQAVILDCLRYWVTEYHVDGFHLNNIEETPAELLARDPLLSGVKLMGGSWNTSEIYKDGNKPLYKNLAEYNDGYMYDVRRLLKSDENQIFSFSERLKEIHSDQGMIHYLANTNGFTLNDAVSYDVKHNEENGEKGRDGTEYNCSWNCGAEGKTRRKSVCMLRQKQIRNAFSILFLSQGTPLIYSGDEFGNTQNGNNNAYCQDNQISWLNWDLLENNIKIVQFVKEWIRLRHTHSIFRRREPFRMNDLISCGCPDLSFHGVKAWYPDYSAYSRQLGILLCGDYAVMDREKNDNSFYAIFNFHWEPHEFDLPSLPRNYEWHRILDTDKEETFSFEHPSAEKEKRTYLLPSRSIALFIGVKKE